MLFLLFVMMELVIMNIQMRIFVFVILFWFVFLFLFVICEIEEVKVYNNFGIKIWLKTVWL